MSCINLIEFNSLGDKRGELFSIEANRNLPFDIKRIYYMYGMNSELPRGFHAHKELKQLAICITGSCRFIMDDGRNRDEIILSSPNKGIIIDNLVWHEMHDFSEDCVLMVVANDVYDEMDYIRDYEYFLKKVLVGK